MAKDFQHLQQLCGKVQQKTKGTLQLNHKYFTEIYTKLQKLILNYFNLETRSSFLHNQGINFE